jgi:hypothetical protein
MGDNSEKFKNSSIYLMVCKIIHLLDAPYLKIIYEVLEFL